MSDTALDEHRDGRRIAAQRIRVWRAMYGAGWMGLADISAVTTDPEASVSARLWDYRKAQYGAHTVERRHVRCGLWHYRLRVNRRTGDASGPVKPLPKRKTA
jgi:hypothetical protein